MRQINGMNHGEYAYGIRHDSPYGIRHDSPYGIQRVRFPNRTLSKTNRVNWV